MATIETNRSVWNDQYDWSNRGDEWSKAWGTVKAHWYWALLPRLSAFLPAKVVLEIAPGYGRWTQFLKDHCEHLAIVDLAPNCIEACRKRFADANNISYFVNDGRSLEMIPDNSVDLAFSFDSLVHADADAIAGYLVELSKKLSPHGVGVLHHSNLGEHQDYMDETSKVHPQVREALIIAGVLEGGHFRAPGMTAKLVEELCAQVGLQCIGQEKFPWYGGKRAIDCMSVFTRPGSRFARPNVLLENSQFMQEAEKIARLARVYGG